MRHRRGVEDGEVLVVPDRPKICCEPIGQCLRGMDLLIIFQDSV